MIPNAALTGLIPVFAESVQHLQDMESILHQPYFAAIHHDKKHRLLKAEPGR